MENGGLTLGYELMSAVIRLHAAPAPRRAGAGRILDPQERRDEGAGRRLRSSLDGESPTEHGASPRNAALAA